MKKNKELVLLFEYFSLELIGKDPFLVPYYLGKELGCSVSIVYPQRIDNGTLPSEYKGVKLIPVKLHGNENSNYRIRYFEFFRYLWVHACDIDVVMRFFAIQPNYELSILYKIRNPRGKFYIKMDVTPSTIKEQSQEIYSFRTRCNIFFKQLIHKISRKCIDVISCETDTAYQELVRTKDELNDWGDKLVLMPNGFDEELLKEYNIQEKKGEEKKNMMLTVGRIGSYPKNSEMFLDALKYVDLRNWECYFVGPIEEVFKKSIDAFYDNCPEKRNSVFFIGSIYNKRELWEYYNDSKLFVFTSLRESYGLVLAEAKRFRNFILSTPVGASYDIIDNNKYGKIVKHNDAAFLAEQIQLIIDGKTNIDVYDDFDPLSLSYQHSISLIVSRLA